MGKTFQVDIPLRAIIPRKTMKDRFETLNMNQYRNWDWRVSSTVKKLFHEQIKHLFEDIKFEKPITVTWRLYKKTKARSDKSNVYAVQSKFVFDTMTEMGCFPDDNDDYIKSELQLPTRHDKDNPRCTFIFEEIEEEVIVKEQLEEYC